VPQEKEVGVPLVDGPDGPAAEAESAVGDVGVGGVEALVEVELLGLDALGPVLHDVGPCVVGVEVGGPLLSHSCIACLSSPSSGCGSHCNHHGKQTIRDQIALLLPTEG